MIRRRLGLAGIIILSVVIGYVLCRGAHAGPILPGPYPAVLIEVVDGDTFKAQITMWPGIYASASVRIRGIDAPELRTAKCAEEKELALKAKGQLLVLLTQYPFRVLSVGEDAYAGRYDASVQLLDGRDVSEIMIASGLARPYDPRVGRLPWCGEE